MKQMKGLTLVELLIVISIMLILTGVLLPNLSDTRKQARDRKRLADMRAIQTALQLYKNDQADGADNYPDTLPDPGEGWSSNGVTYMKEIPKDPLDDTDSGSEFTYHYSVAGDGTARQYTIYACMERAENFATYNVADATCTTSKYRYTVESE